METALARTGQQIPPVPKDQQTHHPPKPWIKTRLGPRDWDARRILDNWYVERKAAPNLAQAIRLYDAYLRGDLDAMQQIAPMLGALLGRPQRTRPRSRPPLDSDSGFDPDSKSEELEGVRAAICDVCSVVYQLNRRVVDRVAARLVSAGFNPADVRRWYAEWWRSYWLGKPVEEGGRNERPAPEDIPKHIGKLKDLPPVPVTAAEIGDLPPAIAGERSSLPTVGSEGGTPSSPAGTPASQADPPTSPVEACDDDSADSAPQVGKARPGLGPCWAGDKWHALLGQLQIQLNRATYSTWFARLRLVEHVESDVGHRFVATVPNAYMKDWIDRHALPGMARSLAELCRRWDPASKALGPVKPVEVVIEVDEWL